MVRWIVSRLLYVSYVAVVTVIGLAMAFSSSKQAIRQVDKPACAAQHRLHRVTKECP